MPIHYIKSFRPTSAKDFDSAKAYLVQWRGDLASHAGSSSDDEDVYYKAQILMLGGRRPQGLAL